VTASSGDPQPRPAWAPPDGRPGPASRPPSPPPPPSATQPAPAPTWPEPSVKLFRVHAGSTVIDLPLSPRRGDHVWVATAWPDPREEQGWARRLWQPGPQNRGFIPAALELGDVVEFGAEAAAASRSRAGPRPPHEPSRWYGYVHAIAPEGLLLRGPYPDPGRAHAAAQRALLAWTQAPPSTAGRPDRHGLPDDPTAGPAPVEPAQPPATVMVSFHGQTATIGDPRHGWLTVPAERLAAAMARPPTELAALLRPHPPALCGQEPPITLAALAARHLPSHLPPTTHGASAPPTAPPPPTPTQEVNLQ